MKVFMMELKEVVTGLNGLFDGIFIAFIILWLGLLDANSKDLLLIIASISLILSIIFFVLRYFLKE